MEVTNAAETGIYKEDPLQDPGDNKDGEGTTHSTVAHHRNSSMKVNWTIMESVVVEFDLRLAQKTSEWKS